MTGWTEQYNCHSASLGGGALRLSVNWNSLAPRSAPSGYEVSVGPVHLKRLFADLQAGKAAAIELGRKVVKHIEADLDVLEAEE